MIRANRRKFHYIYKITCIDTGKYYIGMHSTDNLEDGYFGSGKVITASVKKHGTERHLKEILEYASTRELLKLREKELVNEVLLCDRLCMNLKLGGDGGFDHLNTPIMLHQKIEAGRKGGKALQLKLQNPEQKRVWGEKMSKILTDLYATGKRKQSGFCKEEIRQEMVKRATSPEANAKRSATMKMKSSGAQNSQFGSQWIHNAALKENKKISKHEDIPPGWYKGRKMKF